jgi:pimeloyl-ACP methyl ester carboxylesterase
MADFLKRTLSAVAVAVVAVMMSGCAFLPAIVRPPASLDPAPVGQGVVYLFRGGFNIFSTGMDDLAAKLRAANVDAVSLGHNQWRQVAAETEADYAANRTPIVLVGHSWGALAANLVAMKLNETNTPVPLMILYDPTESVRIPPNVKHVINFISNENYANGFRATALPGGNPKIENIPELAYSHISIDNAEPLYAVSTAAIMPVVTRQPVAGRRKQR